MSMQTPKNLPYNPMKITFYFKFAQTEKRKKEGYGTIYYYLMISNRKSKEISSRIPCHFSEWNPQQQRFLGNEEERKNNQIAQIKQILNQNKTIQEAFGEEINADELIEMTTISKRHQQKFTDVLQRYIDEQYLKIRKVGTLKSKANIEESTWLSYIKRQKRILEFFTHSKKINMQIVHFDDNTCRQLDDYLTQTGRGQLYSTKHVKLCQTVMRFAFASKIIKVNFTDAYKNKSEPKKRVITLNNQDYQKLREYEWKMTDTEKKYVDVLIFMRENLLHVGDYLELTQEHIKHFENGQTWLIKPRKKRIEENNQIQVVPMSEVSKEIIAKYGSIEAMPKTHSNTINRYIKIVCKKAGIELNVSTKLARSSGISLKYNFGKVREHLIAEAAGWTTTRELPTYLMIDMDQMHDEFLN